MPIPTLFKAFDRAWENWRDARAKLAEAQARIEALEGVLRSIRDLARDQGEVCSIIAHRAERALGQGDGGAEP